MEFSWQYTETMRRLVSNEGYRVLNNCTPDYICPVMLTFDISPTESEVPTTCRRAVEPLLLTVTEPTTIVVPLSISAERREAAGADTIIKWFSRALGYSGRIAKIRTPKGEVYYGTSGLILDKNMNPLFLSTRKIVRTGVPERPFASRIVIYLSPKVFTDDTGIVNKALAKKGITFYLSSVASPNEGDPKPEIIINDMSKFFKKVEKPNVNAISKTNFSTILKENIDEVLKQFYNDRSRN